VCGIKFDLYDLGNADGSDVKEEEDFLANDFLIRFFLMLERNLLCPNAASSLHSGVHNRLTNVLCVI